MLNRRYKKGVTPLLRQTFKQVEYADVLFAAVPHVVKRLPRVGVRRKLLKPDLRRVQMPKGVKLVRLPWVVRVEKVTALQRASAFPKRVNAELGAV